MIVGAGGVPAAVCSASRRANASRRMGHTSRPVVKSRLIQATAALTESSLKCLPLSPYLANAEDSVRNNCEQRASGMPGSKYLAHLTNALKSSAVFKLARTASRSFRPAVAAAAATRAKREDAWGPRGASAWSKMPWSRIPRSSAPSRASRVTSSWKLFASSNVMDVWLKVSVSNVLSAGANVGGRYVLCVSVSKLRGAQWHQGAQLGRLAQRLVRPTWRKRR